MIGDESRIQSYENYRRVRVTILLSNEAHQDAKNLIRISFREKEKNPVTAIEGKIGIRTSPLVERSIRLVLESHPYTHVVAVSIPRAC